MSRIRLSLGRPNLVLLAGLLLLAMMAAAPAGAHAVLLRSLPDFDAELPQSPDKIELWFSEPLESGVNRVRLITSTGQKINLATPVSDPADPTHLTVPVEALPPGIYTVAWRNLSRSDGHQWSGSFPFTVLNADGSRPEGLAVSATVENRNPVPSPGETLARWLGLIGGALFFGGPLFLLLVVRRDSPLWGRACTLALQLMAVSVLALLVGAWLQIWLQANRMGGLENLASLLLETRTNALLLTRQILALSGWLLLLNVPQPWPLHRPELALLAQVLAAGVGIILLGLLVTAQTAAGWGWLSLALVSFGLAGAALAFPRLTVLLRRQVWPVVLLLGALLLLTFSSSSHANVLVDALWPLLADTVHLLAAATWTGGLVLLALLTWKLRGTDAGGQLSRLALRFSTLASAAVAALIVTGILSSVAQLPDWTALLLTPYGLVLLGKLALVAVAWLAALLNNRQVHRRAGSLQTPGGQQEFRRRVGQEAVVSLIIFVSVAMLTQTTTPRNLAQEAAAQQPAIPFNQVIKADDLYVYLQIDPNKVGRNSFLVRLYTEDRGSVGEVQLARLILNYQDEAIGQTKIDLTANSASDFSASGAYLNRGGNWNVSVYIRRRGVDDIMAPFSLNVPAPGGVVTTPALWPAGLSDWPVTQGANVSLVLGGLGVLLLGLGWRFRARLRSLMGLMVSLW